MYEICFSDSAKGALSMAGTKDKNLGGAVAVFFSDGKKHPIRQIIERRKFMARQKRLEESALPIDIERENIVAIGVDFSLGDISKPIINADCPQKRLIHEILTVHSPKEEALQSLNKFWDNAVNDLEKLNTAVQSKADVRIWADSDVRGQCGLAFVCSVLKNSGCRAVIINAPEMCEDMHGKPVPCRAFGNAEPLTLGRLAAEGSRELTAQELNELAAVWEALKSENAPLRVIENGRVKSADIDYYDNIIREEIPPEGCSIGEAISRVLGKRDIKVCDYLIAKRISAMLESGELKCTQKSGVHFYSDKIAFS